MPHEITSETCPQCGGSIQSEGFRVNCAYCGASLIRSQNLSKEHEGSWGVHLRAHSYIDQQAGGIEAFRMLIPKTWQFEGGVFWRIENPGMPAVIALRVFNPEGLEAFEVFPNLAFYWTNQPMTLAMFPIGSLYYGNEVRPPAPVLQVLNEIVIPRVRNQIAAWQIIHQEHLPDLPQLMRANSPGDSSGITHADGGRIRIRYPQGGDELEEEFFGLVEVTRVTLPMFLGVVEHIYWFADYLFSYRTALGQLDRLSDQFLSITRSFRLNPAWYNRFIQVSQFLIQSQIRQIRHIGQISRIISQTNEQISDSIMASYESRQAVMDRLSTEFSQTIRGVDEYYDPFHGQGVELPGGYNHAWSNNLGEYILTDDPFFNPNIETNLNWEILKKK